MANTTALATKTTNFLEEAKKIEEKTKKFNDLYDYDPITKTYTAKTKAKTYSYPYKGRKNQK